MQPKQQTRVSKPMAVVHNLPAVHRVLAHTSKSQELLGHATSQDGEKKNHKEEALLCIWNSV